MLSIKGATQNYFAKEFAQTQERYLSRDTTGAVDCQPVGKLARQFGLKEKVSTLQYERLCAGQHPKTGVQLVAHQNQKPYLNRKGKLVTPVKHRPGWDVVFSAPKGFSLAALVGKDERLLEAHRQAVRETLAELEKFALAKMGNRRPAERTGNLMVVQFEHDSARPVDSYIAPQLHIHNFIMNMTKDAVGQIRALETGEIYAVQHYLTTVYRARLAAKAIALGYELDHQKNGKWEIIGLSQEFLAANSPRSRQRIAQLAARGLAYSPAAAEFAVLETREKKVDVSSEEVRRQWSLMNARHGNQVEQLVKRARERTAGEPDRCPAPATLVTEALDFAIGRAFDREAVVDETRLLADALKFEMGSVSLEAAKRELLARIRSGALIEVARQRGNSPQGALTTPEMLRLEAENIQLMKEGQNRFEVLGMPDQIDSAIRQFESERQMVLNSSQREAVRMVLANRDRVVGLEGKAGVGKTTVLEAIRRAAYREGFRVRGLAPTGKAADQLRKAGIEAETLQAFVKRSQPAPPSQKVLYVLDESSLASTRQIHQLFQRLGPQDRILLVGDTRQHLAVEAGSPFAQLQNEGMRAAHLGEIVRQQHPGLRQVVGHFSAGRIRAGLQVLEGISYRQADGTNRPAIVELPSRAERLPMMARDFLEAPDHTLCIVPDNRTRSELNRLIHEGLKAAGRISAADQTFTVLTPVRDLTPTDRKRAASYEAGNVIRFLEASFEFPPGSYARVQAVDRSKNKLTVEKENGEVVTYNPRRRSGVEVFVERECHFSVGERIQFTSGDKPRRIDNRDTGRVVGFDKTGVTVRIEGKEAQNLVIPYRDFRHVDYGYAMTSYSAQGTTIQRVLEHVDTAEPAMFVNERMAYVGTSRAVYEARVYADDKEQLAAAMERKVGKRTALEAQRAAVGRVLPLLSREVAGIKPPVPVAPVISLEPTVTVSPSPAVPEPAAVAMQNPVAEPAKPLRQESLFDQAAGDRTSFFQPAKEPTPVVQSSMTVETVRETPVQPVPVGSKLIKPSSVSPPVATVDAVKLQSPTWAGPPSVAVAHSKPHPPAPTVPQPAVTKPVPPVHSGPSSQTVPPPVPVTDPKTVRYLYERGVSPNPLHQETVFAQLVAEGIDPRVVGLVQGN
ncbi:MAG: relaxase domain-containing protein, partial [Blastocatellia bacterium]|nr:relaxase domain-containing protein [Blastocatellia bacterium]